MKQLLAELDAARSRQSLQQASTPKLHAAREQGQRAADALSFSEATTRRRLIDTQLVVAGWKVGSEGAGNDSVGQEHEVDHQPTGTGKGKADYVLWGDNGKPLAVIEAKTTSIDAEAGRTPAKCYADGLEAMTGHRPVIFYTNGYDIWIWNDAQREPPRKLYGLYSQASLEYMMFQRSTQQSLSRIAPDPKKTGRIYQLEAIKRVTERFAAKHRKALIVLATGTGKTRMAVSLCDVLLRAGWAKRILFLCDRRELRKQAHNVFKDYLPGEPRTFVTSATAKERPDLVLAQDVRDRYYLIEFKRPSHSIDRDDENQAEKYRDDLTALFGSIDMLVIGGKRRESFHSRYDRGDVRIVTYEAVISRARTQLDWLLRQLTTSGPQS